MADSPYVIDVTRDNFETAVMQASQRVPVLVDFWAEWCGPCQMQLPILLQLADAYAGKFILAKIDTDREQDLAMAFNIRSIPTMKLFRNGEVVEEVMGAQSEGMLRALLDRYIERESDTTRAEARARFEAGQGDEALAMLQVAAADDPDNTGIQLDMVRIALQIGQLDTAANILRTLPLAIQEEDETKQLFALLDFARTVESAPDLDSLQQAVATDGGNLAAREQLAARYAVSNDFEAAMEQYLEILKRDKTYNEGAGRKGLIAVFELLGNQGELVSRYRRAMSNYLL